MKIRRLKLKKYERLFLSEIDEIEYIPDNKIQIILGANGSGKSSILTQLTPLPANLKRDYSEDGYKVIEIEHNGNSYELASGFYTKGKHNFIYNGVELNPGGTKKVQEALVKEHFNITPHVHDIMLGLNNLTNMPPKDRKKWFTELSTIDYTYPITVYNKIRQRHRDVLGGIKVIQEDIVKTEEAKLSREEVLKIKEKIVNINKLIEYLLSVKTNISDTNFSLDSELIILGKMNKAFEVMLMSDIGDVNSINNALIKIDVKLEILQHDIIKIEKQLKNIDSVDNEVFDKKEYVSLLKLKEELKKQISIDPDAINDLKQVYEDIRGEILSHVNQLMSYRDIDVSNFDLKKYEHDIEILERRIAKYNNDLSRLVNKERNLSDNHKDDNKITCPSCSNVWYLNYSVDEHKKVKQEIEILEKEINQYDTILSSKKSVVERYRSYYTDLSMFKNFIRSYPILKPIWGYIFKDMDIKTLDIDKVYNRLDILAIEYQVWLDYLEISKRLEELSKLKTQQETKIKMLSELGIENKEVLENKYTELISRRNSLLKEKERYESIKTNTIKLRKAYDVIKDKLKKIYSYKNKELVKQKNYFINEVVNNLKSELIKYEDMIRESELVDRSLSKYTSNLELYKEKEIALRQMVKDLSPTEGLIAKSMNSFLNVIISDMNKIINTVWSYELKILPCTVTEENDLDYKFKMVVDDKKIIDDISMGSSAMQEIVNLAFRIVFSKYMKIDNNILILDEFGRSFDPLHRVSAYEAIDKIISNEFSQVYIVSHFMGMYGRFGNSDISVINSDNIDIDDLNKYNEVMKIKNL